MTEQRRLSPLAEGDHADRSIERAVYEIRRVIAGQDAILERVSCASSPGATS